MKDQSTVKEFVNMILDHFAHWTIDCAVAVQSRYPDLALELRNRITTSPNALVLQRAKVWQDQYGDIV